MRLANVYRLGVKELYSLWRDPMMLFLIVYAFSANIFIAATGVPETLQRAALAIADEDQSQVSSRITGAFYPPYFTHPTSVTPSMMDSGMDAGRFTFALDIPPNFQRDLIAGRQPTVQLNVDATRMTQAFVGAGFIQQILQGEATDFVRRYRSVSEPPVGLEMRARFNPTLSRSWFGAVMEVINAVTMLSIVLTGAALIREREHGTVEHLLAMPVTPLEIMAGKVWSMGLVVLAACATAIVVMVQGVLKIPIEGSVLVFLLGALLHLFATTSLGIFLATLARSMPQFGLLLMLVLIPLQLLSGGVTPRESMPGFVLLIMQAAPTTHFVKLAQAVLYRGAGFEVVWPQLLALAAIGAIFFAVALARFRRTIGSMA